MKICVVGTGYVGLVTGAVLSDSGHSVVCIDMDEEKIEGLRRGKMPIFEPGLEGIVARNVAQGRLAFETDVRQGVQGSNVVFLCVGTPMSESGYPLMDHVFGAAKEVALGIVNYTVVVNKSTVPIGTAGEVSRIIRAVNPAAAFDVVSNPEFLREGCAISDSMSPDRIVIGAPTERAAEVMQAVYASFECPKEITDPASAEIIKYASNAFLATKISFINSIADICEATGADVRKVARSMGHDSRIGPAFLMAGLGYGGSCFPKDTHALSAIGRHLGIAMPIVDATIEVNDTRVGRFVGRISERFGGVLQGRRIAVLGLAFKPDTDDLRESRSVEVVKRLVELGANIVAHDPVALEGAHSLLPDIELVSDLQEALKDVDAAVLATDWGEYLKIDWLSVGPGMRHPILFDGRNLLDAEFLASKGFEVHRVGQPARHLFGQQHGTDGLR